MPGGLRGGDGGPQRRRHRAAAPIAGCGRAASTSQTRTGATCPLRVPPAAPEYPVGHWARDTRPPCAGASHRGARAVDPGGSSAQTADPKGGKARRQGGPLRPVAWSSVSRAETAQQCPRRGAGGGAEGGPCCWVLSAPKLLSSLGPRRGLGSGRETGGGLQAEDDPSWPGGPGPAHGGRVGLSQAGDRGRAVWSPPPGSGVPARQQTSHFFALKALRRYLTPGGRRPRPPGRKRSGL